jgi:hypothetical protein
MSKLFEKKYIKYKQKYLELKGTGITNDIKDIIQIKKPITTPELRKCVPHRMQQQSGTCWYNAILNVIILTPILNNNIYKYINELLDDDKKLINEINTFLKLDLKYDYDKIKKQYNYPKYKLKHLVSSLFILFKQMEKPNNNVIKPNISENFIADQAAHIKSIGKYGSPDNQINLGIGKITIGKTKEDLKPKNYKLDSEFDYIIKNISSNPKYYGTGYDPYTGMIIMMEYFKLNRNNDIILIGGAIMNDDKKSLKLIISDNEIKNNKKSNYIPNINLNKSYSLEAICYDKLLGLHASAGIKCNTDNNKYIIYDSNNIIREENWYETQKDHIIFSIYITM